MSSHEKVKTYFDSAAATYSRNFDAKKSAKHFGFHKRLAIVTNLLSGRGGRFLDCACGTGEITAGVLTAGAYEEITVCDISSEMLSTARKAIDPVARQPARYGNVDIFDFLATSDTKFDVILCLGLIAHVGKLEILLRLLASRLSLGGSIVMQSTLAEHPNVWVMRRLFDRILRRKTGYQTHYYTSGMIEAAATTSGLKIASRHRYLFNFPLGDRLAKPLNYRLELVLQGFAKKHGSECIFVLEHASL